MSSRLWWSIFQFFQVVFEPLWHRAVAVSTTGKWWTKKVKKNPGSSELFQAAEHVTVQKDSSISHLQSHKYNYLLHTACVTGQTENNFLFTFFASLQISSMFPFSCPLFKWEGPHLFGCYSHFKCVILEFCSSEGKKEQWDGQMDSR